jgi:hypothetical protein
VRASARAQVLDTALKQVKRDRAAFATLVKEGARLREAGNVLADPANLQWLSEDEQVLETLTRIATRKGPISDALTAAARRYKSGEHGRGEAAREFLVAVRAGDFASVERRPGDGGGLAGDPGASDRTAGRDAAGEEEALAPDPNQRALFQAGPVVKLTGRELGDPHQDYQAALASARSHFDALRHGPPVRNPDLGAVAFSRGGEKKTLLRKGPTKLQLIAGLREIVERGRKVGTRQPREASPNIKAYHLLETPVRLGEQGLLVRVLVREDNNGQFQYDLFFRAGEEAPLEQSGRRSGSSLRGASEQHAPLEDISEQDRRLNLKVIEPGQQSQTGAATPRGAVELGDGIARITLSAGADATTFLHESGHVFLEVLHRRAGLLRGHIARHLGRASAARRDRVPQRPQELLRVGRPAQAQGLPGAGGDRAERPGSEECA